VERRLPGSPPRARDLLSDLAARLVRDAGKVRLSAIGTEGTCQDLDGFVRGFVPPDGLEVCLRDGEASAVSDVTRLVAVRVRDPAGRRFLEFDVAHAVALPRAGTVLLRVRPSPRRVEQRDYARAPLAPGQAAVSSVLSAGTRPSPVRVIDISEGGLCLEAPLAALPRAGLRPGAIIVLLLSGEVVGRPPEEPFVCSAIVRRVRHGVRECVRMGVAFLNPSPAMSAAIARFVREQEREDIRRSSG
jgi:hypothetical protein